MLRKDTRDSRNRVLLHASTGNVNGNGIGIENGLCG